MECIYGHVHMRGTLCIWTRLNAWHIVYMYIVCVIHCIYVHSWYIVYMYTLYICTFVRCIRRIHRMRDILYIWTCSCVAWLLHVCEITRACVWFSLYEREVANACMVHLYVWRDSCRCVILHVHMCDFISKRDTWHMRDAHVMHICGVTHTCVWDYTFTRVTWFLSAMWQMRGALHPAHVWRDSYKCDTWHAYACDLMCMCEMGRLHDAFMCVVWRIFLCEITRLCMTLVCKSRMVMKFVVMCGAMCACVWFNVC